MVITIQIWLESTQFQKDFSVCIEGERLLTMTAHEKLETEMPSSSAKIIIIIISSTTWISISSTATWIRMWKAKWFFFLYLKFIKSSSLSHEISSRIIWTNIIKVVKLINNLWYLLSTDFDTIKIGSLFPMYHNSRH